MIKKAISITALSLALVSVASAEDGKLSVGGQSSWLSHGASVKYDFTDKITGQAIAGLFGTLTNFSARGLYDFYEKPNFTLYGYGSIGVWKWSNAYYDESIMGYGAGAGIEYDIRKLDPTFPPLFLTAEAGATVVNFDHYTGYNTLTTGVGVHYKF